MSDCKVFDGKLRNKGYGTLYHDGKMILAHRLAYCESNGITLEEIKGLIVRHTCDNPECVNPEHLLLGTHAENMNDMKVRGRAAKGDAVARKGTAHGSAVLTDEQVIEARRRYVKRSSHSNSKTLAKEYGVSAGHMTKVLSGKLWSHLK